MSGNKHIIRAISQENAAKAEADAVSAEISEAIENSHGVADQESSPDDALFLDADYLDEDDIEASRTRWMAPALAIFTVVAWSGLYLWAMQSQLASAASTAPAQWIGWIVDWSVPVLLVGVVWLIAMRNSAREANRFAVTAAMLSQESTQLENRLTVVNRELSLAREFLGSQSRELESLGRIAAERISTHAQELQDLIRTNGAQVDAIGTASETALANMNSPAR